MKKVLLTLSTAAVSAIPITTVIACNNASHDHDHDHDHEIATLPDGVALARARDYISKELRAVTGSQDWENTQKYIMDSMSELNPELHEFEYTIEEGKDISGDQINLDVVANLSSGAFKYNDLWIKKDKEKPAGEQEWDHVENKFKFLPDAQGREHGDAGYEDHIKASDVIGRNIVAEVKGTDENNSKVVTIGSHYDLFYTYAETGSDGFQDNIIGMSTLIELAKEIKKNPLKHTVRFVFFDVEENGLEGSYRYAQMLKNGSDDKMWVLDQDGNRGSQPEYGDISNNSIYINLDSFAGGDNIVLGRGLGQTYPTLPLMPNVTPEYELMNSIAKIKHDLITEIPYYAEWNNAGLDNVSDLYKADGTWNEKLSTYTYGHKDDQGNDTPSLRAGEHQQGDHRYLVNVGVKSLFFESTNYQLAGQYGRDGYSQTSHSDYWAPDPNKLWDGTGVQPADTYTQEQANIGIEGGPFGIPSVNVGGYKRKHEWVWGKIWHNNKGLDKLSSLESNFPNRLQEQSTKVFNTVLDFVKVYSPQ